MKTLILSVLLLSSSFAQAQSRGQQDALQPGYDFCGTLNFSSDKQECLSIVSSASFFDQEGVNFCKMFNFASEKLSCLKRTANQVYEPALLSFCQKFDLNSDRTACQNTITGKYLRSTSALNLCSSMHFASEKLSCLTSVVSEQAPVVVQPSRSVCTNLQFHQLIDNATSSFRSGRFSAVLRSLADLASLADYCFQ